jgi:ADP-heptose:LPS heptosyltransferase
MTAPSENILVIKHGALGDIVQAMDAFASLRAGHPDAHLAVLTYETLCAMAHICAMV